MKIPEYAEEILKVLNDDCPNDLLYNIFDSRKQELKKGFVYLKEKGLIDYTQSFGDSFPINIKITSKGIDYLEGIDETILQKNDQTINIHAPVQNVAQIKGDNNKLIQIVDNSQYNILKQMIENDSELDEPKKKKLLETLDKFNKIKETGENAYNLIKTVGGIAIKYVPLFFSLL